MLPKLQAYGGREENDSRRHPLRDHYSSVNTSIHTRYLSYEDEPTDIGRLKKLKEFLCSEEEFGDRVVVSKQESDRHCRNKENL